MGPKVVDVDPDITDSNLKETQTGPEISSTVLENESAAHSVLETSLEPTQLPGTTNVPRYNEAAQQFLKSKVVHQSWKQL